MHESWRTVALREIASTRGLVGGPFGSNLGKRDYQPSGIPVIRGQNLASGRFVSFEDCVYVSDEKFERDLSGNTVCANDLVFTQRGTLGQVAVMPGQPSMALLSQSQMRLRVHGELADPWFVYYCTTAPEFVRQIRDNAIVAGVPHINLGILGSLKVPMPSLGEQRRIAGVLGALDDLIDTNCGIADDCTALWRAIVRDALTDASDSAPLSDLADFVNGKNFTKEASVHGRPVIRTPEVRRGPEAGTVRSDADAADANVAREGDTLFVWSGSLTVGRWMWEEGLINQHVFKVVPKGDVPAWLVFALIEYQMPWFLSIAADKATTMGHIKREQLDAAVPVPSSTEIGQLGSIVEPLWNEALQCGIAAQQLARARDELLPLLLTGRVRVDEVAA